MIRREMTQNIQGYNKHLDRRYLSQFDLIGLLGFTHPLDRPDFVRKIYNQGIIGYEEFKMYINSCNEKFNRPTRS